MDTYGVMLYPPPFQVTSWSPPQFWQGTEPLEAGDSAGRCRPLAARKAKNKNQVNEYVKKIEHNP